MSKVLTAEEILSQTNLSTSEVEVPEWGGTVRLRTLSAREAIEFQKTIETPGGKNKGNILIVSLCAVDENGKRLFRDDQLQQLMELNVKAFTRLARQCVKLNGLDETELDAEAKNS